MKEFTAEDLKKIYRPPQDSSKGKNGQILVIGGSTLFHGAPLLALKAASRVVDMALFSSPEPSVGEVAEKLKSSLFSFIWVPWEEVEDYIKKVEAVLIGPGLMRAHHGEEKTCDEICRRTKEITEGLLSRFPEKQWVIDAGSLQVTEAKFIPPKAILTPNKKEYEMLFGSEEPEKMAKKYQCFIVVKNSETIIYSSDDSILVRGGNAGLTKGGTGDILAGLTVALAAKNPPFFAASAASLITKKASDELYQKVGFAYNADDLAQKIPEVLGKYFS